MKEKQTPHDRAFIKQQRRELRQLEKRENRSWNQMMKRHAHALYETTTIYNSKQPTNGNDTPTN